MARPISSRWSTVAAPISAASPTRKITIYGWSISNERHSNAAVRRGWIESNPAKIAQRPKQKPPEPDPPSPTDAARLVEAAFEMSEDWGTLVWLVVTTGMRRAEVAGLRWSGVDLDAEVIEVQRTYVQSKGKGKRSLLRCRSTRTCRGLSYM